MCRIIPRGDALRFGEVHHVGKETVFTRHRRLLRDETAHELQPAVRFQLAEYRRHLIGDGARATAAGRSDLGVRASVDDEERHFALGLREYPERRTTELDAQTEIFVAGRRLQGRHWRLEPQPPAALSRESRGHHDGVLGAAEPQLP